MRFKLLLIPASLIVLCGMNGCTPGIRANVNKVIPLAYHGHTEEKPGGVRIDERTGEEQKMGMANIIDLFGAITGNPEAMTGIAGTLAMGAAAWWQAKKKRDADLVAEKMVVANAQVLGQMPDTQQARVKKQLKDAHKIAGVGSQVSKIVKKTGNGA